MPKILDDCVRKCEAKPKEDQPESCWAVCIASLREAGKIKKGKEGGPTWVLAKQATKAAAKAKKIRGGR